MKWIRTKGGAWLMDIRKPPNFALLEREKQDQIQAQLDEMIRSRYIDINYNGNNLRSKIEGLSVGGRFNPFDGRVVIVDEAHNFVSRIVNQLSWDNKRGKWSAATERSVAFQIYNYLMSAENARIVLLSGTPIINYPNEIAIMFNILRGFIQTWEIPV
jgi:N12 class adenine-specific DNA methylase